MFRGANKVTLDAKGRVAMPARYRDTLVERSEGSRSGGRVGLARRLFAACVHGGSFAISR